MTTAEQFELYKTECKKYINKFSLNDWQAYFTHERLSTGAIAQCNPDYVNRTVELSLDSDGVADSLTDDDVKRSAFHEVCELLLTELDYVLSYSGAEKETLYNLNIAARHAIIRRLENVEFDNG